MRYSFPKPRYLLPLGGERDSPSRRTKRHPGPVSDCDGSTFLASPSHSVALGVGWESQALRGIRALPWPVAFCSEIPLASATQWGRRALPLVTYHYRALSQSPCWCYWASCCCWQDSHSIQGTSETIWSYLLLVLGVSESPSSVRQGDQKTPWCGFSSSPEAPNQLPSSFHHSEFSIGCFLHYCQSL